VNKVILSGRLVRDPEVRYTQGAEPMAVARFTLAVDRRKREGEQSADFINCVAFRNRAEFVEKFGKQGTKFIIEGSWQTGSYTNKDGQKVYTNDCLVENIEFAESKAKNEQNTTDAGASPYGAADEFVKIPDDVSDEGLPFK
jgi:single-strand DNA-binding protein